MKSVWVSGSRLGSTKASWLRWFCSMGLMFSSWNQCVGTAIFFSWKWLRHKRTSRNMPGLLSLRLRLTLCYFLIHLQTKASIMDETRAKVRKVPCPPLVTLAKLLGK